jgi:basic membrane protein A
VRRKHLTASAAVALVAVLATAVGVALGGGSAQAATKATIRVGLVTDIGGLNDRSFNYLANLGAQQAKKKLGVQVRVLTSTSNAQYVPNLSSLAQQGYDLVIGVGFLMGDALSSVASNFPTPSSRSWTTPTTSPTTTSSGSPSPPTRPPTWPATWPPA